MDDLLKTVVTSRDSDLAFEQKVNELKFMIETHVFAG